MSDGFFGGQGGGDPQSVVGVFLHQVASHSRQAVALSA